MARRSFLKQVAALPLLAAATIPSVRAAERAKLKIMMKSAWGSDDPTKAAFPFLHGVHGTAAFGPGYVLFAGLGGEISDDPDERREELDRLRYPRWEPEYRLKLLRELKDYQLVLLFHTPPEHKGLGRPGSEVVAELVNTYTPRILVCGGERGTEMLGRTLVVAPGSLGDGNYAIADIRAQEAQLEQLAAPAAS